MVLHAEFVVVGVGGNVEHVFDPVGTIWQLEFIPVGAVVFEAAIPVETKTQEFNVETILGGQVFDDKTGVDQVRTNLFRGGGVSCIKGWPLDEGNVVSLRV